MSLPTREIAKLFQDLNACAENYQNFLLTVASELEQREKEVESEIEAREKAAAAKIEERLKEIEIREKAIDEGEREREEEMMRAREKDDAEKRERERKKCYREGEKGDRRACSQKIFNRQFLYCRLSISFAIMIS